MIEHTIKQYKSIIDRKLGAFIRSRIQRAEAVSPFAKKIMQQILEFNLRGGKRIRPILVIFGYKAFGGRSQAIVDASLSK